MVPKTLMFMLGEKFERKVSEDGEVIVLTRQQISTLSEGKLLTVQWNDGADYPLNLLLREGLGPDTPPFDHNAVTEKPRNDETRKPGIVANLMRLLGEGGQRTEYRATVYSPEPPYVVHEPDGIPGQTGKGNPLDSGDDRQNWDTWLQGGNSGQGRGKPDQQD